VRRFDRHCIWTGGCVGESNVVYLFAALGCGALALLAAALYNIRLHSAPSLLAALLCLGFGLLLGNEFRHLLQVFAFITFFLRR
jgi:hypothetical protein